MTRHLKTSQMRLESVVLHAKCMAKNKKSIKHVVSQEDIENNPELEQIVEVGETIEIPEEAIIDEPAMVALDEEPTVSWSVFKADKFIRTYSIEIHGIDAGQLAKQFAEKIGGEVKLS